MKKIVQILRGLPSTGKSEYASHFPHAVVCSADDFFMKDGKYNFVGAQVPVAHQWCFGKFIDAMNFVGQAEHIIVDNTNTMKWEYSNYIKLAVANGYDYEILNFNQNYRYHEPTDQELADRNKHGVPADGIKRMRERWEDDSREKFI
tara:strand:+ start:7620 stop:8060 length:441 start_codon:yes stop_codon:yes gene_type:complete